MSDKPFTPVERPARFVNQPIMTVGQHILQEQRRFPGASGEFSWLLSGITLATKLIEAKVRRAGLSDVLGSAGDINVQGEVQQKLDVYANDMLIHALGVRESVAMMASEENEQPMLAHGGLPSAKYIVVFDPLDGSSNIDVNVSVGTTFSILRRTAERARQPGLRRGDPAARRQADRGRLRGLWLVDDAGVQRGQRRARLHARSGRGSLRALAPEHPHSRDRASSTR